MKRVKSEVLLARTKSDITGLKRLKLSHFLLGMAALYMAFLAFRLSFFLQIASYISGNDPLHSDHSTNAKLIDGGSGVEEPNHKGSDQSILNLAPPNQHYQHGKALEETMKLTYTKRELSEFEKVIHEAWVSGEKAWEEALNVDHEKINQTQLLEKIVHQLCPSSMILKGEELAGREIMFLPCGLAPGSSITLMGKPQKAHQESNVSVSKFVIEFQGIGAMNSDDPPRLLHLKLQLKGDWSGKPIIEHTTGTNMQWGLAQRCEGMPSKDEDDLVDGLRRCERWNQNDVIDVKEPTATSLISRFLGNENKIEPMKLEKTWPFPFEEGKLFALTIRAGQEGYHINVDGRHVSSFSYRKGFDLEDVTTLAIKDNVDVNSVYATSLPISYRSFSHQVLEISEQWKSNSLPKGRVQLFIGVISASNHFVERMTVRKTWMQYLALNNSRVVARFFVALNSDREVNALLMKEANFYGDVVILPFIDHYDLIVLKTIAICEHGVRNFSAAYIMKCDDDTFVRVDTVLNEIKGVSHKRPLYMGNLNLLTRPFRSGKWTVTFEEWQDEVYPPYANGPAYIVSRKIAKYIVSKHENHSLQLFKMEDVSLGIWVQEFNDFAPVQYSHSGKFCQYGCTADYYTAHYQSPRKMICLWYNLKKGHARCCNFR